MFEQDDIMVMSIALDEMCAELRANGVVTDRERVAARIIELAKRGERSPTKLRDRVLKEAGIIAA